MKHGHLLDKFLKSIFRHLPENLKSLKTSFRPHFDFTKIYIHLHIFKSSFLPLLETATSFYFFKKGVETVSGTTKPSGSSSKSFPIAFSNSGPTLMSSLFRIKEI